MGFVMERCLPQLAGVPAHPMSTPASDLCLPLAWKVAPNGLLCRVQAVAVSDDGGTVLGGTRCPLQAGPGVVDPGAAAEPVVLGVQCYDGEGRLRWDDPITAWDGVCGIAVTGDGRLAAAGGGYQDEPRLGFVRAYDVASGDILLDDRPTGRVRQVALSHDGAWLAAVTSRNVELYCRFAGTEGYHRVASHRPDEAIEHELTGVSLAADGTLLAITDNLGDIGVLHNSGGTLVPMARLRGPQGAHRVRAAVAPGGDLLVAAGPGAEVVGFDQVTMFGRGEPWRIRLPFPGLELLSLAIDATGRVLACTCDADGSRAVHGLEVGADGARWSGVCATIVAEEGMPAKAAGRPVRAPRALVAARSGMVVVEGGDGIRVHRCSNSCRSVR